MRKEEQLLANKVWSLSFEEKKNHSTIQRALETSLLKQQFGKPSSMIEASGQSTYGKPFGEMFFILASLE